MERKASLNDFEVLQKLDESRFPIYLLRQKTDQTPKYVIKLFRKNSPLELSSAFERERRFAHLSHLNIIQYYSSFNSVNLFDIEEENTYSGVIMEYAPHGNIFEHLSDTDSIGDPNKVRKIFSDFLSGLSYLHANKIAHIDIKPENVMIGEMEKVKLIDLGSAYMPEDIVVYGRGSKDYRAPELAAAKCKKPFKADIYSAGILFFVLMVGHLPFSESIRPGELDLYELLQTNPEKFWSFHTKVPGTHNRPLDEEFKKIFSSMVAKDPQNRPTVQEILEMQWFKL